MQEDEVIHLPQTPDQDGSAQDDSAQNKETDRVPGMGETETLPGGGITESNAVPDMPPGSDMADAARDYRGGGLDAADTAQPTSTADPTGDRATGLTGLRGG